MAQIVVAAAGAAIGFMAGGVQGAQLGWMAGSLLGSAFAPGQKSQGPRLTDLTVSSSVYGAPIPYVQGHPRIAGQIVWASTKREIATTTEQGGKGGGGVESTSYTYEVDLLILLTDNEIVGVSRIWSDGKMIWTNLADATQASLDASANPAKWTRLTVYTGDAAQLPDPTYEAAVGTANAPAYRGRGSVFIEGLQLGGGGQLPNLTFEVVALGSLGAAVVKLHDFTSAAHYLQVALGSAADYSAAAFDEQVWSYGAAPFANRYHPNPPLAGYAPQTNWDAMTSIWIRKRLTVIPGQPVTITIYRDDLSNLWVNGVSTAITSVSYNVGTATFTPSIASLVIALRMDDTVPGADIFSYAAFSVTQQASVLTLSGETIQASVSDLCLRSGLSAGQFDVTALAVITKPVRAMSISQVTSARSILDTLASCYFFDAVQSDKLYFRPRGNAIAATIPYSDLGVVVGNDTIPDPLPLSQSNELEIPAQMALTYSNIDGDYQPDTQYSDRLLTGQTSTAAMQVPLGFTASEAKTIVDVMLMDQAVSILQTSISLGLQYAHLEPTDVIAVTSDDGSTYRMRLVKKTDADGVLKFDAVLDDAVVLVQAGTTVGGTTPQIAVAALPDTSLELLDIPLLRDVDNLPGHYVAVTGSNASWTSASLFDSLDNISYALNTTINSQAVMGACSSVLGSWTGGNVFDEISTITVFVGAGQLASVTRDDILNSQSANAALVGREVIQYRTATLISTGTYTLSGLLRGRRGTEWAMTGHAVGEKFVQLGTGGLRFIALQSGDLGKLRYYKAVSAGQKLSAVPPKSVTPAGIVLKCLSPVDARADRTSTDTIITWKRRTRVSTRLVGTLPISAPLGETAENYEVELFTDATFATIKRTFGGGQAAITYPSAWQIADFGANQTVLHLRIYQISPTVGRGYPLQATV